MAHFDKLTTCIENGKYFLRYSQMYRLKQRIIMNNTIYLILNKFPNFHKTVCYIIEHARASRRGSIRYQLRDLVNKDPYPQIFSFWLHEKTAEMWWMYDLIIHCCWCMSLLRKVMLRLPDKTPPMTKGMYYWSGDSKNLSSLIPISL